MLCLSRKVNERVKIGDDITVTVVRMGHGLVRLGFEAPEGVVILRQEVYDRPKADPLPGSPLAQQIAEKAKELARCQAARILNARKEPCDGT